MPDEVLTEIEARDRRIAELESQSEQHQATIRSLAQNQQVYIGFWHQEQRNYRDAQQQLAASREEVRKFVNVANQNAHERNAAFDELAELQERLDAINTPELFDFQNAVVFEAQHQRLRWGSEHDTGKTPADWFWLIGYLAGKALNAHMTGNTEKALHHTITVAAATANWHAAILGATNMRPGIDPVERGIESAPASAEASCQSE